MATKKKSKKKSPGKESKPRSAAPTKVTKKKASKKAATAKRHLTRSAKAGAKKTSNEKVKATAKKKSQVKPSKSETSFAVSAPVRTPLSDDDAQGLSNAESADSESVSELVDEGNAFEAGAVSGVEEADDADEREVHTHEVSEDDVPEEYLDQD